MNKDELIEDALKELIEKYIAIETDLLEMIAEHFQINGTFINSDIWRIEKLQEMNIFNNQVIEYLAKKTNTTPKIIKKCIENIGKITIEDMHLDTAYSENRIKITPEDLLSNISIKAMVEKSYKDLQVHFIRLSNTINSATRQTYLNIIEEAYLKTSLGTHSYQEAIRESINNLSNIGINTLTYQITDENGNIIGLRHYDIEGIVRRDVLTASRQLANDINLKVINETDTKYLYLSEHLRCRPTHFHWQGTIIKSENLVKVTKYGDVTGLGGVNCNHYVEAYFGDARGKELKKYSKKETEKAYNISQKLRYLERGLRKWKRKVKMYNASKDIEALQKSKNKVKEWQYRIIKFTKENKIKRNFTNEYVT